MGYVDRFYEELFNIEVDDGHKRWSPELKAKAKRGSNLGGS